MRVLFDKNVPYQLKGILPDHEVEFAARLGWGELTNGNLLAEAERSGFDVLLTADKNLRYQNNLTGKKIGVVVLPTNRLSILKSLAGPIAESLNQSAPGRVVEVKMPLRRFGFGSRNA